MLYNALLPILSLLTLLTPALAAQAEVLELGYEEAQKFSKDGYVHIRQFEIDGSVKLRMTKGKAIRLEAVQGSYVGPDENGVMGMRTGPVKLGKDREYWIKSEDFAATEFTFTHPRGTSTCHIEGKQEQGNTEFVFRSMSRYLDRCKKPGDTVWVVCGEAGSSTNPRSDC